MPTERPFLTSPSPDGETASGDAPDALFDLAVGRAWAAQRRVGAGGLAAWHARTRFARRVGLDAVRSALALHPGAGEWHWVGGPAGRWVEGKAPFP